MIKTPGYYLHGHGPQVPQQVKLEPSSSLFNQMLLNEMLQEGQHFLSDRGYDKKFACEIYGKGDCPTHGRFHHSNNWVVIQPHGKEKLFGGKKFTDQLPDAIVCCYHKCGARNCCPRKKNKEIIFLPGPLLL